jgi:magnesium transporter
MIHAYIAEDGTLFSGTVNPAHIPPEAVWIDVCEPDRDEEASLEKALGLDIPTREDMGEIEASSRLSKVRDALYITAVAVCRSDSRDPTTVPITFILAPGRLITVRHDTPQSFKIFHAQCDRREVSVESATGVVVAIWNTMVDRLADIIERIGADLDALSREIFRHSEMRSRDPRHRQKPQRPLEDIISDVGNSQDVVFRIRESLQSLDRAFAFAHTQLRSDKVAQDLDALERDVRSLHEYQIDLFNKVQFMLDATMGLIGIQQNGIIKIISIVSVVFTPPTLVASIYGMNFDAMPELHWPLGYPFALAVMVATGTLPYLYFKWRRWF